MTLSTKRLLTLFACFLVAVLNQNCGEQSSFNGASDLASVHDPSILDLDLPSSKPRVGDRVFISNVFADIFLPQSENLLTKNEIISTIGSDLTHLLGFISDEYSGEDNEISDIILEKVLEETVEFHGLCSINDLDETCASNGEISVRIAEAKLQTVAAASVTREGYRLSACKDIIDLDRAISNLRLNATGSRETIFSENQILKIFDLFYPDQEIDEEVYESLVDVYNEAVENGEGERNIWRAVVTPLCYSAGWQVP